jgi:hypothetical protein
MKNVKDMSEKEYAAACKAATRETKPAAPGPKQQAAVRAMSADEYQAAKRAICKP